jgi:hypothetical protein
VTNHRVFRCWLTVLSAIFFMAALPASLPAQSKKPNILVIFGDDIGQANISRYTHGVVGYMTPNIDRIGEEGMTFTDYYAENSCTAGRSSFITGQSPLRTGLTKVGAPGGTCWPSKTGHHHRAGRLSPSGMPPASSARITSETATNICPQIMASTVLRESLSPERRTRARNALLAQG